eukprot:TRINITY_DN1011_c0_g1_i1.p1 TRINITY_DN1011_c0_g1~~TRINITY_DN1011_c0_g1_i1.p1  ORF type:complete len:144 (+),score=23.84 TRINITY_DN1011_c0_g1_i1:71-502(+)
MGDLSVHVISKLGKASVAGAAVEVFYNADRSAKLLSPGSASSWELLKTAALSEHGGNDDLVSPGNLKEGLYALQFDFAGMDAASRNLYRKEGDGTFVELNPSGWFMANSCIFVLDIADAESMNHLVLSMGDKEVTVRPGVRQH